MLRQSVGQGGRNGSGDVFYVQLLLSDWLVRRGREPLAIDGRCGPKTIAAITAFQKAIPSASDGRMDPDGPSICALQKAHIAALTSVQFAKPIERHFLSPRRVSVASVNNLVDAYLDTLRAGLD